MAEENKKLKILPKYDFVFKKIFGIRGRKDSEEFLKDFLSSIIEEKIEKVEIEKDVHLEKMYEDNKEGILDVRATLNDNEEIDIEIQLDNKYNMVKRTLYYWAGLYYEGLEKGQNYLENRKVVVISILDYNIFPRGKYHEKAYITMEGSNERLLEDLELHYIQLKKSNSTDTKLGQWLEFLKYEDKRGLESAMEKNKVIKKANERLEYLTGDDEVKRLAVLRDRNDKSLNTHIAGERMKAKAEGIEQGKAEGIKEGEKKGREETNKEVAQKMKESGMSKEDILKILDITEEKLEEYLK